MKKIKARRNKKRSHHFSPDQLMSMGLGFAGMDSILKIKQDQKIKKTKQRRDYLKAEIGHIYEMSHKFVSTDVKRYVAEKCIQEKDLIDRFPNAQSLPYHITIGAYEFQDFAIALNLSHVDAKAWSFEAEVDLKYEDDEVVKTSRIVISKTLPEMTHLEFVSGCKNCRIDHGHGLKTVGWRGFNEEILRELDSDKSIMDDTGIERVKVVLNADVKFINTAAYEEFLRVTKWVQAGYDVAEKELRDLWIREQMAGSTAKSIGLGDVA